MNYFRLFIAIVVLSTILFPGYAQEEISDEYVVKIVYFLPMDRTVREDIDTKIGNMITRVQNFYADQMENYGFGRKTFRIESDENGDVVIHHVIGKKNAAEYKNKPASCFGEFANRIQTRNTVLVVFLDHGSGTIGSACGVAYTGRRTLIPASGGCFSWITVAHEIGHNFVLPHDFRDGRYIMSYGPGPRDRISECAAEWLDLNPYFNGGKLGIEQGSKVEVFSTIEYPQDNTHAFFEVTDPDGLNQIFFLHGPTLMHSCQSITGNRTIVHLDTATIKDKTVIVRTLDVNGNARYPGKFPINDIDPSIVLDISTDRFGLDNRLIGYWTFDEAIGKYAFDATGNGNYARLSDEASLRFNEGKTGGALYVQGRKVDAIVTNGGDLINGLTAFTLSLWVKASKVNTDRGFIFPRTPNDKDEIFSIRYDAQGLDGSGTNVIKAGITTTSGVQIYESASGVQTTEWQHITLTWRTGRKLNLYINGVLDQPTFNSKATEGEITDVERLIIGRGSKDNNNSWNGLVDDVRLYNKVLSDNEITNLPFVTNRSKHFHGVALTGVANFTTDTVESGNGIEYIFTVTNTGNLHDTFKLTTSGNVPTTLSKSTVSLASGASSVVTFTVPENTAIAGDHTVEIRATSVGDITKFDQFTTTTNIMPIYGVSLKGVESLAAGLQHANEGIDYTLTVTNTGNTDDTILLTTEGDINAILSKSSISLSPGASSEITLTVPGSAFAASGDYAVKVTATSETENTIFAQITTVTYIFSSEELGLLKGLIGHWNFDEIDGDTVYDSTGSNNAIIHDGAILKPNAGVIGGAIQFDGSSEGVVVENGADLINGLDAFTIALWVKSDRIATDKGFIFPTTPNGNDEIFSIRYDAKGLDGGGTNVIKAAISTTKGNQIYESANNVQTTEWQHITLTWRSGRGLTLYVNGVLDQPTFNSTATEGKLKNAKKFIIGRGGKDQNGSWGGLIDDVRLYNRVLSPSEITNLVSSVEMIKPDPIYGVGLIGQGELTNQTQDASDGVTFHLTVTNTGDTTDTIKLATSGDAEATLSQESVTLASATSLDMKVMILGTALTQPGEYVVKVSATSQGDNFQTTEIITTTTVYPKTRVFPNYPNPCNPETWIPFQLAKPSDVTITIYSMRGKVVRTLALGHQASGVYHSKSNAAYWDGTNKLGEPVASGIYVYRFDANDFSTTNKILILK
ncbi:T9SS type A sorting domain-containing protein [Candidatus Poribacteria bacterium]|nr:T9SS type A sorting domain-containing protein [Candidatus Poribacteria bacterium]